LINRGKRARIVVFDLVAEIEAVRRDVDLFETDRHLNAREELRRVVEGLEKLSPRVRQIVRLRKIDGLTVQETAAQLGIGKDAVNHQLMMGMKALADHMLGGPGQIVRPKANRRRRRGAEP
jgi:RNA polymerase sigma-70 factor (ECF subfamily)